MILLIDVSVAPMLRAYQIPHGCKDYVTALKEE